MAVTADILRRLGKLRLEPEAFEEVLSIIADLQAADEHRKAGQRERTSKHRAAKRDGNVTVTAEKRDADVTADVTETPVAVPNDPAPCPPHTPPITPTPNTPSDPAGSGSPSEPSAPVVSDPRRDLFSRSLALVGEMTGRAPPGCRALIGKWLGIADDSAVIVVAVIDDAVEANLMNPIPWIEAAIRKEAQRNGSGSHDLFPRQAASGGRSGAGQSAVAAALARRENRGGLGSGGWQDRGRSENGRDRSAGRDDPSIEDADWSPAPRYSAAH